MASIVVVLVFVLVIVVIFVVVGCGCCCCCCYSGCCCCSWAWLCWHFLSVAPQINGICGKCISIVSEAFPLLSCKRVCIAGSAKILAAFCCGDTCHMKPETSSSSSSTNNNNNNDRKRTERRQPFCGYFVHSTVPIFVRPSVCLSLCLPVSLFIVPSLLLAYCLPHSTAYFMTCCRRLPHCHTPPLPSHFWHCHAPLVCCNALTDITTLCCIEIAKATLTGWVKRNTFRTAATFVQPWNLFYNGRDLVSIYL